MENDKSCPCYWTTPCSPICTCIMPVSSHGCSRCCRYGSDEQRRAKAVRLTQTPTEEQLRYMVRVMDYQHRGIYAGPDIADGVKFVSEAYQKHRDEMDFGSAAIQAKLEWVQKYLASPYLPRDSIGSILDLQYIIKNVKSDCGLLVATKPMPQETGEEVYQQVKGDLYKIIDYEIAEQELGIIIAKTTIADDFPYIERFPQDRKPGTVVRPDDHTSRAGYLDYCVLNQTILNDEGDEETGEGKGTKRARIILKDGVSCTHWMIKNVHQLTNSIAVIETV